MTAQDLRGNPSGSSDAAARAAVEQALWRMMSFYDTPLADLDTAMAADPGWPLPHTMKAGFLLSLTEPTLLDEAAAHLSHARALAERRAGVPAAEAAHLEALQQVIEGRWHAACRIWDELLIDEPRNALALQWAQLWDFYRGDTPALRGRPARALPDWDEADPLYPHVLALHAFGLEENNLHPQAEEAGRRALALEPRAPWAVHAVAHVMEMQGRFEEGSAWLRQHQPQWAEGNGFAGHLWWHKALFRLEALDVAGVLRLVDNHLSGPALQITLQRVDAAAILWRLHLLGEDITALAAALVEGWALGDGHGGDRGAGRSAGGTAGDNGNTGSTGNNGNNGSTGSIGEGPLHARPGYYVFNDVHAVLALVAAGQLQRAEAYVARCAERALAAEDAARANHAVAREVGAPLMRGLLAFARGQMAAACELMMPARAAAQRIGGSHAQRDVIDQTLIAAVARGGPSSLGRALINERRMSKPVTPLTRHWLETLRLDTGARA